MSQYNSGTKPPDICKTFHHGGKLVFEPLKDFSGVGFFFPTKIGMKYKVRVRGLEIGTITAANKLRLAACDANEEDANDVIRSPYIVTDGNYEVEYVAHHTEGFAKIHTEHPTDEKEIKMGEIEVVAFDLNQNFSDITNSNKEFIIDNLQTNLDIYCSQLANLKLKNSLTDYTLKNDLQQKINDIWAFNSQLKAAILNNTVVNLAYQNLNLPI